jgi:hypothetical protein
LRSQRDDPLALERLGHVADDDPLGKALHDRECVDISVAEGIIGIPDSSSEHPARSSG